VLKESTRVVFEKIFPRRLGIDGEKLCFTVLFPYTEEFYNFLLTLEEPYKFACNVSMAIQIRTRRGMGK